MTQATILEENGHEPILDPHAKKNPHKLRGLLSATPFSMKIRLFLKRRVRGIKSMKQK